MKIYRYGKFENILGDISYVIQRKYWIGWINSYEFTSRIKMVNMVNQLKEKGYIIYEV